MDENKAFELNDDALDTVAGGVNEAATTNQPVEDGPLAEESQVPADPSLPLNLVARF